MTCLYSGNIYDSLGIPALMYCLLYIWNPLYQFYVNFGGLYSIQIKHYANAPEAY